MHKVVPAKKPRRPWSLAPPLLLAKSKMDEAPAPTIPPIANAAMPTIFTPAVTVAERSTHSVPMRLIRAAVTITATPKRGTRTSESSRPKGRSA